MYLVRFAPYGADAFVARVEHTGFMDSRSFDAQRAAFRSVNARFRDGQWYAARALIGDALAAIRRAGFAVEVTGSLADDVLRMEQERLGSVDPPVPPPAGMKLFAHQVDGIRFLRERRRRGRGALLADDMGLGKTSQAILSLDEGGRAVVICPSIAKGVWRREVRTWRPDLRVVVCEGRKSFRWPGPGEVVILNYEILPGFVSGARGVAFDTRSYGPSPGRVTLFADECQNLKSWSAARTKNFRALSAEVAERGGTCALLSGTPMLNRPSELWVVLQAAGLAREAFEDYETFRKLFHAEANAYGGTDWGEADASVPQRLARVMLRRTKDEVLDLPGKMREIVDVEISLSASARKALTAFMKALSVDEARVRSLDILAEVLNKRIPFEVFRQCQQALAIAKIPATLQLVEECADDNAPAVVFSNFLAVVDAVAARPGWAKITGDTPTEQRTLIEDAFQAGRLRGIAATIRAAGTALTLTRANRAIFNDLDWTPANNAQAEDRIYRIGQTRSVQVTVLAAQHPLDQRVAELLTAKRELIDRTVDAASQVRLAEAKGRHLAVFEAVTGGKVVEPLDGVEVAVRQTDEDLPI